MLHDSSIWLGLDLACRRLIEMYYDTELPIPIELTAETGSRRVFPAGKVGKMGRDTWGDTAASGWLNSQSSRVVLLAPYCNSNKGK